MIEDYVKILEATGVNGYPYVSAQAEKTGKPGELATPIGFRVDDKQLLALTANLASLAAPKGVVQDQESVSRGKQVFETAGCTSCHNEDQARAVPTTIHDLVQIFPETSQTFLLTGSLPSTRYLTRRTGSSMTNGPW
ncbi:MAG: c-type cytochrome [Pseudaminobacter sp.]|nr:c-type cytochrome [Pseudaminobacter sp.]